MNVPAAPVWIVALALMEKTTTPAHALHRILENSAKVKYVNISVVNTDNKKGKKTNKKRAIKVHFSSICYFNIIRW